MSRLLIAFAALVMVRYVFGALVSLATPGGPSAPPISGVFGFGVAILAVSAARLRYGATIGGTVHAWLWRAAVGAIGLLALPLARFEMRPGSAIELAISLQMLAVATALLAICALEAASKEEGDPSSRAPKWRRSPRAVAVLVWTSVGVLLAPLEVKLALGVLSLAPLIFLLPGGAGGGLVGGVGRETLRYGTAMAGVTGAWLATRALHPALEQQSFMVFLAAVAIAAAVGGLGPGVLATLFSIGIIDYFYLSPRYSFVVLATTDLLMLGVFTAIALLLSGVGEALRVAHHRALEERERALGVSRFLERQLRLSEELRGAKAILSSPIQRIRRPGE